MLITHDNNRKPDNFLQYQKKKRKEYILNGGIIMKLVPLSDRVVLKQCEAEETTKSGIILMGSVQEKLQEAEVIAVILAESWMEKKLPCR